MPKKVFHKFKFNENGDENLKEFRHLTNDETVSAGERFVKILNDVVYKSAYRRFKRSLNIVMIVEGERHCIDLHCHFAIAKPSIITDKEFVILVHKAIEMSEEFVVYNLNYDKDKDNLIKKYKYKLDLIDDGWSTYITKDLDGKDFNNLYFPK